VVYQLALGRNQQHGHLEPFALRVQDLKIELHAVHVERHVLLGLPANDLAGFGLSHAIHRDLLHDDIPPADRGDD
jgi:hypothetical protein